MVIFSWESKGVLWLLIWVNNVKDWDLLGLIGINWDQWILIRLTHIKSYIYSIYIYISFIFIPITVNH